MGSTPSELSEEALASIDQQFQQCMSTANQPGKYGEGEPLYQMIATRAQNVHEALKNHLSYPKNEAYKASLDAENAQIRSLICNTIEYMALTAVVAQPVDQYIEQAQNAVPYIRAFVRGFHFNSTVANKAFKSNYSSSGSVMMYAQNQRIQFGCNDPTASAEDVRLNRLNNMFADNPVDIESSYVVAATIARLQHQITSFTCPQYSQSREVFIKVDAWTDVSANKMKTPTNLQFAIIIVRINATLVDENSERSRYFLLQQIRKQTRFLDHFVEIRDRVVITNVLPGIYMVGESRYNIQDFEAAISQGYGFNYLTDMRNNTQVIVLDLQPSLKFPDVTGLVRKPSLQMNCIFRKLDRCLASSPGRTDGIQSQQLPYLVNSHGIRVEEVCRSDLSQHVSQEVRKTTSGGIGGIAGLGSNSVKSLDGISGTYTEDSATKFGGAAGGVEVGLGVTKGSVMTKDGYEASYTGVGLGVTYDGLGGQIGVNVGKSKDFYGNTTSAVGVTAGVTAGGVEANIKGRYENARLNDGTELTTVSGGVGVKVNGIGGEIGGGVTTLKDADGNKQVIGGHVNAGVTAHGVTAGGRIDIDKSGARIGAAGLDMDIDGPGVVGYNAGVGYKAGEGFGTHAGMQNNAMKLADTGDNDD